jgi:hypothetical protein
MGGEFVIKKSATDYYGHDLMEAINQGRIPKDKLLAALAGVIDEDTSIPCW